MSSLQAVFWDMDGTLVDTEPYWIQAEYRLVEEYGGTWSDEQAHRLVGQALTYSASVLQEAGVTLESEAIINRLIREVADACREQIPWRPGARELLESLRESGIRCALVTMSYYELAAAITQALPQGHMEFIISGDMVTRGKPDPEPYLQAFEKMAANHVARTGEELDLTRCMAIEDSGPGSASAAASGMVTLVVPHMAAVPESDQWYLKESLVGLDVVAVTELVNTARAVESH